jgi:hypothetical protein
VNGQDSKAEIFDVFLCHNSEDKPAVREIDRMLVKEGIKPWLDEDQIRPETSWQTALGEQIGSIRSTAVSVGDAGLGLAFGQNRAGPALDVRDPSLHRFSNRLTAS